MAQIKPALLNIHRNLNKHVEYIRLAKGEGVRVLVFPELSLTGYLTGWITPLVSLTPESREVKVILEESGGMVVIFGGIFEEKGQYYNAAFVVEDGEIKGIHRKVYLPTYGMFDEGRFFTTGWEYKPVNTSLGSFGILICEDAWHLESYLSYADVDIVVIMANNPLRVVLSEPSVSVWHKLVSIPSLFFGIPTIYANRVGVEDGIIFYGSSRIIQGNGKVEAEGGFLKEEMVVGNINANITRAVRYSSATLREHLNAFRKNSRQG